MRILPEAIQILLKVWTEWVENADYALITIEPAYASRLLEKVKLAQEVKARYGHFHQLTFFEYCPVVFGGELEDLTGSEQLGELERVVLGDPIFIPRERQARVDCVTLNVTHEEVRWEGYIKHTLRSPLQARGAPFIASVPERNARVASVIVLGRKCPGYPSAQCMTH